MIPKGIGTESRPSHNRKNYRPKPMEVWLADIPFDNGQGSKIRPVIVVRENNGKFDVVMMTSSKPNSEKDFILMDPESAGLEYGSTVKAGKIYSVTSFKFRQKKGNLSDYDREELGTRIRK